MPPEIVELENLEELNLSFNRLTTLPPEIGQLENLTYLALSYNLFSSKERSRLNKEIKEVLKNIDISW
ncbi:MAG: leucine-rich repeat domain-containing protein [Pirellulaceae bacterium]|nr:leucine-rich repeat domain-containing protein [Pirellulaceae bacterium]